MIGAEAPAWVLLASAAIGALGGGLGGGFVGGVLQSKRETAAREAERHAQRADKRDADIRELQDEIIKLVRLVDQTSAVIQKFTGAADRFPTDVDAGIGEAALRVQVAASRTMDRATYELAEEMGRRALRLVKTAPTEQAQVAGGIGGLGREVISRTKELFAELHLPAGRNPGGNGPRAGHT